MRLANWMQLAHPYSVDLYAEKVLAHAKLVVVRLLGGASYWRYGLDEAVRVARANGTKLVAVPGDATWDAALAAEGTVPAQQARKLWSYLVEGGSENLANALRYCAHLIGEGEEPPDAATLPSAGVYGFYVARAILLCKRLRKARALRQRRSSSTAHWCRPGRPSLSTRYARRLLKRGLTPLPLYVSSLKAKEDAAFIAAQFAEHDPAIVLNATAFALSQPGQSFAGTVLDGGTGRCCR